MKNLAIIVAVTLLAAGSVTGGILYRQTSEKEAAIEKQLKTINTLNERLSILEKEQPAAAARKDIDRLIAAMDDLNSRLTAEKEAAASVREALTRSEIRVKEREHRLHSLEELLGDAYSQIETLNAQIEKIRTEDAALISELQKQDQQERENGRSRETVLEKQLSEMQTALSQADARRASDQRQAAAAIDRMNAAEAQVRLLERQIAEKTAENTRIQERIQGFLSEKGAAERRLQELESAHHTLIRELRTQINNEEAAIAECKEKLAVTFIDRVLFESARATLSAQGKALLKRTGSVLRNLPEGRIRITGHTDDKPIKSIYQDRYPTNWELSSARAAAVVRFFEKETGIPPERMEAVGCSHHQPLAGNETPQGRAQNRRVEIMVAPSLVRKP